MDQERNGHERKQGFAMTDPINVSFIKQLQDNPFSKVIRDIFADWLSEHGDMEREAILRAGNIPLTELDESAVRQLMYSRIPRSSFDKRFSRNVASKVDMDLTPWLTPKQYLWLWVMLHRYRRSVKDAGIRGEAERRYDDYIKLLDMAWLKPNKRRRTKKTSDLTTLFDDT